MSASERGPAQAAKGPTVRATRDYEKPRLIDYGRVSKLTQAGGVSTRDVGNMKRRCL